MEQGKAGDPKSKEQGNGFSVSRLDKNRIIMAAWQKHTTLSGREKVKIDGIVEIVY